MTAITRPVPVRSPTHRVAESARLVEGVTRARAGRAGLVVVRGRAGTGKSALLDGVPCDGFTVLRVTCREADSTTAYATVRELFRAPTDLSPVVRERLAASAALTAEAADAGEYPTLRRLDRCVARLTAHRPLALVFDDAHWCDAASLRWLCFLLNRSRHRPLLVLAAVLDGATLPDGEQLTRLTAWHASVVLELGPLDLPAVAEIVRQRLGDPEGEFTQECAEVSGGNPRLLHRLLDTLASAGVRPQASETGRILALGRTVAVASVRTRLAALPEPVRDVAAALAAVGDIGPALVGAVARVSTERTRVALTVLREEGVLAPDSSGFAHEMFCRMVIDTVPPLKWERLRIRAAVLLNDTAQPVRTVADQLLRLPRLEYTWMTDSLLDAADEALRQGDPVAGVRYLRRLLTAQDDPAERERTRVRLAEALIRLEPAVALPDLLTAVQRAATPVEQARLAVHYGDAALAAQCASRAVPVLGAALETLRATTDGRPTTQETELETQLRSSLVVTGITWTPDTPRGRALVRESATELRNTARPVGDTLGERRALAAQALLRTVESRSATAAVALARRSLTGDGWEGWMPHSAGWALVMADEVEPSAQLFERALEESRSRGDDWTHHHVLALRALALCLQGAVDEGLADTQRALEIDEQAPWRRSSTLPVAVRATLLAMAGRPEAADELLARRGIVERADPPTDETDWTQHLLTVHWGWSRWRQGDQKGALRRFRQVGDELRASGIVNPVFSPWWANIVWLLAEQGRTPQARELVEEMVAPAAGWGTPRALGQVLLARAMTADPREAVGLYREAADMLAGTPDLTCRIRVDYHLGRTLLRTGDAASARKYLRQAADLATRTGAHTIAHSAAHLLVTAGGRIRKAVDDSAGVLLTKSELQVAELAVQGLRNQRIAGELFVTLRTVETHLTAAYRKFGVRNRQELSQALPRWQHSRNKRQTEGGAEAGNVSAQHGMTGNL
ncbi:AAA family ATPase [Streptomyces sp. NPDC088554]|uniref:helix-turn-helix transcriptional regulator n=1 Tax=Streptomyces sp. NPDC088554 TaxID=3365865 RepID=UPI0037F89FD9